MTEVVEQFRDAVAAAGVAVPSEGYGMAAFDGFAAGLSPMRLPDGLRGLWERVAVARIPLAPSFPRAAPFTTWFADPGVCWWLWRAGRDRPGLMPEALLPVARFADVVRLVELADGESGGGRVFEWRRGHDELSLCYESVEGWLETIVRLIADPSAKLLRSLGWLELSLDRERELQMERGLRSGPAPLARDSATWPERWRSASRSFDDRRADRPPALSISQLLWERPARATVAGLALNWGAVGQGPRRLQIADGTGWLDVWCPAELEGLSLADREPQIELEVTTELDPWQPAGVDMSTWDPFPPQAKATAVRLRTFG